MKSSYFILGWVIAIFWGIAGGTVVNLTSNWEQIVVHNSSPVQERLMGKTIVEPSFDTQTLREKKNHSEKLLKNVENLSNLDTVEPCIFPNYNWVIPFSNQSESICKDSPIGDFVKLDGTTSWFHFADAYVSDPLLPIGSSVSAKAQLWNSTMNSYTSLWVFDDVDFNYFLGLELKNDPINPELWVRSHSWNYVIMSGASFNHDFKIIVQDGILIGLVDSKVVAEIPALNGIDYKVWVKLQGILGQWPQSTEMRNIFISGSPTSTYEKKYHF